MRYRISTLLLLTTAIAISLGWAFDHSRQSQKIDNLEDHCKQLVLYIQNDFYIFDEIFDVYQQLSAELNSQGFDFRPNRAGVDRILFTVRIPGHMNAEQGIKAVKTTFGKINGEFDGNYTLTIPSFLLGNSLAFSIRENLEPMR